jgi:hypothetical protein
MDLRPLLSFNTACYFHPAVWRHDAKDRLMARALREWKEKQDADATKATQRRASAA